MHVIMKGYGEIKLVESDEVVAGEITLHQEGWVAVVSMPPGDANELRWFPNERVAELVWRKNLAVQQRRAE